MADNGRFGQRFTTWFISAFFAVTLALISTFRHGRKADGIMVTYYIDVRSLIALKNE